jgi:hypothetical protein
MSLLWLPTVVIPLRSHARPTFWSNALTTSVSKSPRSPVSTVSKTTFPASAIPVGRTNRSVTTSCAPTPLWMRVVVQIASWVGQTHRAVGYSIGHSLSDVLKNIKNKDDDAAIAKSISKLEAALNLKFFITGSISDSVGAAVNEKLNSLNPSLAEMVELHEILRRQHGADDLTWSRFDSVMMDRIRPARADLIEVQALKLVRIIANANVGTTSNLREKLLKNANVISCLSTFSTLFEAQQLDKEAKPLKFELLGNELGRLDVANCRKILLQIKRIASPLHPDDSQLPAFEKQLLRLCACIDEALNSSQSTRG